MQTLSYSMWDLVPWQGIELRSPALGVWSPSHWTTREVPPSSWTVCFNLHCILFSDRFLTLSSHNPLFLCKTEGHLWKLMLLTASYLWLLASLPPSSHGLRCFHLFWITLPIHFGTLSKGAQSKNPCYICFSLVSGDRMWQVKWEALICVRQITQSSLQFCLPPSLCLAWQPHLWVD